MTTPFESLDDTFNVSPTEETTDIVEVESEELVSNSKSEDREDDYQYARGQLHNIIEKMQMTLDGALEVAFNGAKHLADVVDKLQDLHAKEKKISEEPSGGGSSVNHGTVNNVYMTGTTADMLKMLKEAKEQDK